MDPIALKEIVFALAKSRGPQKSICPSEAARAAQPHDWRPLMPAVKEAAAALAEEGKIEVLQRGARVKLQDAIGPVRLRYRGG
ncbi:MAG: DUF3253 domain-containing protein [Planctomycetota bacterium]